MPDQQPNSPFPSAPPVPNPADPTNSVAGPYVPSAIQTGVNTQTPISAINAIPNSPTFNPAISAKDVFHPQISDFINRDPNPLPPGMSLKDAMFSDNPQIKQAANNLVNDKLNQDPFLRAGGGTAIDTPYDEAKRYDNKKLGFNPLTNNEHVYSDNQGFFSAAGNSLANLVGKTVSYAGQTLGLVGGAAVALPTWDISNMTDNFITRGADWLKDKTEEDFPIYKSDKYVNGNIFDKLGTTSWWLDDAMDRVALTAAMFVPGLAEMKGFSLAGSIGADGIATGLGAKVLQGIANGEGGYSTVMKTFLPKMARAIADGTVDLGGVALKSYTNTLSRAELGAWNVIGQTGLNGKESWDAVMKATGDKDRAATAAKDSFWESLPLALGNTLIELPQMFSTMNSAKSMLSKIVDKETGALINPATLGAKSIAKKIGTVLLTGLEHGQNESMQVAIGRYNEDSNTPDPLHPGKMKDTRGTIPGILGDFMDNINDPNGQNNIALGTIQGILTSVGGMAIDKVNPNSRGNQEKKSLSSLYQMINAAQLQRRYNNGDFAARNPDGSIKVVDGKVINDQQKIAAAGISLAGLQNNLQEKQDAILQGDSINAAMADHRSLAGLAQAYFQDPGGLEHLSNLLKIEAVQAEKNPDRINDQNAEGDDITPAMQLQEHLSVLKDLKKAHDAIENHHAGIINLDVDRTNNIQVEKAKQFIAKEKNLQYHLASDQLFFNKQLQDNNSAMQATLVEPDTERMDDKGSIIQPENPMEQKYNELNVNDFVLKNALRRNKLIYKQSLDKDEQRKAFKQDLDAAQDVIKNQPKPKPNATPVTPTAVVQSTTPITTPAAPGSPETPQATPAQPVATDQAPSGQAAGTAPVTQTPEDQTHLVISADAQTALNNGLKKQHIEADEEGRPQVAETDFDKDDADVELDRLQLLAKKGKLTHEAFQSSYFGQKTTGTTLQAAFKQIDTDPVGFIDKLAKSFRGNFDDEQFPALNTYEETGQDEFTTYDPQGNQTGTYPSEDEAKQATTDANKIIAGDSLEDKAEELIAPTAQTEQEVESDNSDHLQDIQQSLEEEMGEHGKMIVSSLSVASKAVNYDKDTGIAPKDELGRPIFNGGQDSIIDFGIITPGTSIHLRFDAPELALEHPEQAEIQVYTKTGNKETKLGYLHTLEGAKRLLTQEVDVEAELKKLAAIRNTIIAAPGQEFTATVTQTGFGFANKGDKRGYKSIDDATEKDDNAVIAIKQGDSFIGENGTVLPTRFGNAIKVGATVLMLPNTVNGISAAIPVYLNKKSVGTDPKIKEVVQNAIDGYLATGEEKLLDPARNFIYITKSGLTALSLTNNGLFLNANGELIFRGQNITTVDNLLGKLQINVNASELKNPRYVAMLRNSPALQTSFFARTRNGVKEKSYFHQHTIQFSDPTTNNSNTQSNGQSKEEQRAQDIQQKQSVQSRQESNTAEQGVRYGSDADNTRIPSHEEGRNVQEGLLKATPTKGVATPSGTADQIRAQAEKGQYESKLADYQQLLADVKGLIAQDVDATDADMNRVGNGLLQDPTIKEGIPAAWQKSKETGVSDAVWLMSHIISYPGKVENHIRGLIAAAQQAVTTRAEMGVTSQVETKEDRLARLAKKLQQDIENDGFVADDISEVHDLNTEVIENVAQQESSLLIKGFNAFVQEDAVNSIAQLLLSDDGLSGVTEGLFGTQQQNKERVRKLIDQKVENVQQRVDEIKELIEAGNPQALHQQDILEKLKLVADNYDAVFDQAKQRLDKIGLVYDEQGYYDAVDNQDDFLSYDDDSEYTRNNYDSLSQQVKQFISFNPEKIEKDGRIGNRMNSLGLATIVQPAAVYTKMMNWLSEHYFEPTYAGALDMIDTLIEIPDPTIQDIARRLRDSKNIQLKFQFFTNMLKYKTNHTQQLVTVDQGVRARNIEANRNQISNVVFDQMADEFNQLSKVTIKGKDEYGNITYKVDKAQVLPYAAEFMTLSKSKDSYGNKLDQDSKPTLIKYLRPEASARLYQILKDLGFGFSQQGFQRAITARNTSNPKGDAQIGIQNLFTGGNMILRNMAEGESESKDRDLRNPFIGNPTEMNQIAKAESNFRKVTQTDSFRSNGKSYYPFTRMSFIKGIFQQITDYAQTGQISTLLKTFAADPWKSASRFLKSASVDTTAAPELWFARGTKETGGKYTNQEVKDMNDKDFVTSKLFAFQNSGNDRAFFLSDTYSDKTTRFMVKSKKDDVRITWSNNRASLDPATLNKFYNYFQGELRRINKVRQHNSSLPNEQKIAGYHDINGNEGIGKYFVIFNFMNQANLDRRNAAAIYDNDGSVKQDQAAVTAIKDVINQQMAYLIGKYMTKLERYGIFTDLTGQDSVIGINDTDYISKIQDKMDQSWDRNQRKFFITADYLVNSSLNSLEMLTLTGDPAQSPKVDRNKNGSINLRDSIRKTLTEVSKRNASLNAPFDQGISIQPTYKVGFVNDQKINSQQVADYIALLPGQKEAIEGGYKNGDMTDAQELTTVKQHLTNLLSMGRISPVDFIEAFAHFDPDHFDQSKKELQEMMKQLGITFSLNGDSIRREIGDKDMTGFLNVLKPVQRYSRWDANLGMVVETYIKTSSFPLVPALVKGKDFEHVLDQMHANGIDRLDFKSGTKQGLINPQSIYGTDGAVNSNIFTDNVIEMPSAAWGEQVLNPEKDELQVTEGSQQQRLIFVDLKDTDQLNYKGSQISGKDLRDKYIDDHRTIFESKKDQLFKEIGVNSAEGINSFASLSKLSDILQREGLDRDYDRNTLLSLNLNKTGQFEIPLTFLPNSSEIQAMLAAVVSNRILKNKLPGTSLIQGSEVVIKTNGKLKVSEDLTQAKGGIIWTKPEYSSISKLQYIRQENGEVKPAQIVLPWYWKTADGKSVPSKDFLTKEGHLDRAKIDPELLEINGFRIPYAGPNSGMWFEVVGYLPETMGSLVLVPGEIAAQMGADYDVDKLFTYVMNHTVGNGGIRVDNSTARKQAENDIIQAHKAIYLNKDRLSKTIEPTSTDELEGAIKRNLPAPSTEPTQIFDPAHQDAVWLSNRAGQLGIAISASYNTFHAVAQQANLFVKGPGLKFLDADGKVYNENDRFSKEQNYINSPADHDPAIYEYGDKDNRSTALRGDSITRLDRVTTLPNPYTGETRSIASVINNWLQASVDNAKLQALGAGGINKLNFNAALTMALHGFDSDWIIPFINQPILKDYYEGIQGTKDKFVKDFSATKTEDAINALKDKYFKSLTKDEIQNYNPDKYAPLSHNYLKSSVDKDLSKMNAEDKINQLYALDQFLAISATGNIISQISADTKVEVRGLSQSFAEINQQAKDIDSLEQSNVGNVNRLRSDTVSGVYLNVPGMIDDLFNFPDNPIFAYSTPAYQAAAEAIQGLAGRNVNAEQLDDIYKELKQFVYTHPSLGLQADGNSIAAIKDSLLVKGNLVKSWQDMKAKYPNSILLAQLSQMTKRRDNDPDILTMQQAADDISTQIKQEWLDFFKSKDPALVTFINQLTTYAFTLASKEFGPSSMMKFIPFEVMKGIGIGDSLNGINKQLNKRSFFDNFTRQYLQHNPDMVRFISMKQLPKNTLLQAFDGNGEKTSVPAQFTMPELTAEVIRKNPAYNAITEPDSEGAPSFRRFIRTYIDTKIGSALYELQDDERTYRRIDTLGNQFINEYDFTNNDVRSIFPLKQSVQNSSSVDTQTETAEQDPNPTPQAVNAVYGKAATVADALQTIQARAAVGKDDPIQNLHYQLAAALEGHDNYRIEFNNDDTTRGTTFHDRSLIRIHPNQIEAAAKKLGIPYEQALQQTILHEVIHASTDTYMLDQSQLPESKQSPEYKQVTKIYNDYRKNLIEAGSSTFVRGIQDTFLEAEMFKGLFRRFADNRKGASYNADLNSVLKNWSSVKDDVPELMSVIYGMQESMKKAHQQYGISKDANFDLVKRTGDKYEPVDAERVAQIVDYLDKNFQGRGAELKEKYYAYVSPAEFNTMTMTSPGFMQHLNSVQGSGESQSLWQRFKDVIRKIIAGFNNRSLLNDAINAVMDITKASAKKAVEENPEQVTETEGVPQYAVPTVATSTDTNPDGPPKNEPIPEDRTITDAMKPKAPNANDININDMLIAKGAKRLYAPREFSSMNLSYRDARAPFRDAVMKAVDNPKYLATMDFSKWIPKEDNDKIAELRPLAERYAKLDMLTSSRATRTEELLQEHADVGNEIAEKFAAIMNPHIEKAFGTKLTIGTMNKNISDSNDISEMIEQLKKDGSLKQHDC